MTDKSFQKYEEKKQKPFKTYKVGHVSVNIWQQSLQFPSMNSPIMVRTVTCVRSYKDKKTNTWCNGNSFNLSEVPLLISLLKKVEQEQVVDE